MDLDFSRCPRPPFAHQREDTAALIAHPYFFIASEMRTGKSKICVDAAQFMFESNIIDRVIIIAPAPVRDVWADKTLGQIAVHGWPDIPMTVTEFHARVRTWQQGPTTGKRLEWYCSNFEFIRSKNRLTQLMPACGQRTLLILDEGSYVKNHAAQQTKACLQLRKACGRVTILNGTPLFHSPLDLFSQGNLLHPSVLGCPYVTQFKSRYAREEAVIGAGGKAVVSTHGRVVQKIVGWHEEGLKDLQRRFAPITVRRLQAQCLDLPPKLDPVALSATMDDTEWRAYKDMRDSLVVWLQSGDVAVSSTAAIKALRLAQITGGFLGGIEDANIGEQEEISSIATPTFKAIGRSKLDVLLWFLNQQLETDSTFHVVCWFRFRPELMQALEEIGERFPQFEIGSLHGGNKKAERHDAMRLLHPDSSPKDRPVFVGGIEGTGSFGVNMTAAHTSIDYSSGYSPGRYLQKADRIYGPGMTAPCAYYSILAVGPKNQRTIDHQIEAARRDGTHVATWTAAHWIKALSME